jgi:hypothetical protein
MSNVRAWIARITAVVLVWGLVACGGGGGGDSFTPTTYSGTLSGDASGTFTYTVEDKIGNLSGSAQLGDSLYHLAGYTSGSGVNLQFQDGPGNGWITGTQGNGAMNGSWELADQGSTRSGTASATAHGSGGSCDSLIGYWTETTAGLNHWQFDSNTSAQVIQDSTNYPGAVLTTWLDLSSVTSTSITYTITRQQLSGSAGYDYDHNQSEMLALGLSVGPFTEAYTLANCTFTIGGQSYRH